MKKHEMRRLLKQEIAYPELTIRADRAFDAALASLGQKADAEGTRACGEPRCAEKARHWEVQASAAETKKHRGFGKICGIACASVAAVCFCLALLNLAAPEMMESLPGMGEVFQALNGKFTMGSNSPTYPDLIQPVDVNAGTPACQVTVQEAYSEGKYIFLSLKLTSEDENVNAAKFLSPQYLYEDGQEYSITVDGQEVELLREIVFEKGEDGFTSAAVAVLPEKAEHGQKLQVELRLDALRGLKEGTEYRWDTPPEVEVEEPISLSFEVTANTTYNQSGTSGLTVDSVTLESFESTPSVFSVTLRYPGVPVGALYTQVYEGSVQACLEDGTKLSPVPEASPMTPGKHSLGDEITYTAGFNGVPKGTRYVTVTLMDVDPEVGNWTLWPDGGYMKSCVFAEFTVDLESGEVSATETYREQDLEKMSIQDYVSEIKAGPQFSNHIFINECSIGYGKLIVVDGEVQPAENPNDYGAWTLTFFADTEMELPYEVRFYRDGELYQTVPIQMMEDAIETQYGPAVIRDDYAVQTGVPDAEANYPEAIKWGYGVTVYLDAMEVASGTGDTIDRYQEQIVNTETGEVLFDSNDPLPEHSAGEFAQQSDS